MRKSLAAILLRCKELMQYSLRPNYKVDGANFRLCRLFHVRLFRFVFPALPFPARIRKHTDINDECTLSESDSHRRMRWPGNQVSTSGMRNRNREAVAVCAAIFGDRQTFSLLCDLRSRRALPPIIMAGKYECRQRLPSETTFISCQLLSNIDCDCESDGAAASIPSTTTVRVRERLTSKSTGEHILIFLSVLSRGFSLALDLFSISILRRRQNNTLQITNCTWDRKRTFPLADSEWELLLIVVHPRAYIVAARQKYVGTLLVKSDAVPSAH